MMHTRRHTTVLGAWAALAVTAASAGAQQPANDQAAPEAAVSYAAPRAEPAFMELVHARAESPVTAARRRKACDAQLGAMLDAIDSFWSAYDSGSYLNMIVAWAGLADASASYSACQAVR
ncbi:MAG: hypothetical protein ACHQQ3_01785 [Gemmatimonadales bacterium]